MITLTIVYLRTLYLWLEMSLIMKTLALVLIQVMKMALLFMEMCGLVCLHLAAGYFLPN